MAVAGAAIVALTAAGTVGGEEIVGMAAGVEAGVAVAGGAVGDTASMVAALSEAAQSFGTLARRVGVGAAQIGVAVFGGAAANPNLGRRLNGDGTERCCRR